MLDDRNVKAFLRIDTVSGFKWGNDVPHDLLPCKKSGGPQVCAVMLG